MLAGAAALLVAPKIATPTGLTLSEHIARTNQALNVLRAGDVLSVNFSALPADPTELFIKVTATENAQSGSLATATFLSPISLACGRRHHYGVTRDCVVTDARVVVGNRVIRVPIEIKRSGE